MSGWTRSVPFFANPIDYRAQNWFFCQLCLLACLFVDMIVRHSLTQLLPQLSDRLLKSFVLRLLLSVDPILIGFRIPSTFRSSIPKTTFLNLTKVELLSLADNAVPEIPREMFEHTPNLLTLDIARGRIKSVRHDDFAKLKNLQTLIIASNEIEMLEKDSLPSTLTNLHIGRNRISSLNGTLKHLSDIKILFINGNNLTTLDDELPESAQQLMMLMASYNRLEKLPKTVRNLIAMDTCYFNDNQLRSLDGLFSHHNALIRLYLENNKIEYLAEDEFLKSENIDEINLSMNLIPSLNKSLLYVTNLRAVNLTGNLLREFSMQEIYGLMKLRHLYLSNNRIEKLTGRIENVADTDLFQLLLDNNLLKSLDGALAGLGNLRRLLLSNNLLENIYASDFEKMEELEILDLSNNRLKSLEAFSKVSLGVLLCLSVANPSLSIRLTCRCLKL